MDDGRHLTGSHTLATSRDFGALYAVSADEGAVSVFDLGRQAAHALPLPGEPTRIARAGERLFVSLRAERAVAVLRDRGGDLEVEQRIAVGAEPVGVVASEDGRRIYVAASLSGTVHEIDAESLSILRSWELRDEPRWLALHPSGMLYAASAWRGTLSWIELESGKVFEGRIPSRETFHHETFEPVELDRRNTGDPAVTPDGTRLLVPAIYVDSRNPVTEPSADDPRGPEPTGGYSPDRFNPTVVVVPVEKDGTPILEDAAVVRLAGFADRIEQVVVGYIASVTPSPDSLTALATVEGSAGVIAFELGEAKKKRGIGDGLFGAFQDAAPGFFGGSFDFRPSVTILTPEGPRGVAFVSDREALVHGFLDRSVAALTAPRFDSDDRFSPAAQVARRSHELGVPRLPADVEEGRRLFYASNDARMAAPGSGVSCATCHFEGRTDGVTWVFARGPRQTPTLAGEISLTEPVRWDGEEPTVASDAMGTSQGLMGGADLREEHALKIAAYVDFTRAVDAPLADRRDDARVRRGEALFNRPDVACGSCHSGPALTDNKAYAMYGMSAVLTRSLVGIAGSPPYFHDGSAPTLRDVLLRARDGSMGNTGGLSDQELEDLELYLRSL